MAGFSVKKGTKKARSTRPYPVEICAIRYRDPVDGRLVKTPDEAKAAKSNGTRAKARKGASIDDRAVVTRFKDDAGEVVAARVMLPGARALQRKGRAKKGDVREMERELSRDALETFNPGRAAELHSERMKEAHNSDKARRGASTRKKNAATKKKRPVVEIQTQLLRAEQLVKDAQRRHTSATTAKAKTRHGESLRTRRARVARLRAELQAARK